MASNRCENCRFWSDKLAQAIGGPVEAYCLNENMRGTGYTRGSYTCPNWRDAPLGAIDSGNASDPRYGNPYEDESDGD